LVQQQSLKMEPPKSAEVFDTPNSKYWFEGGILFVIAKKGPELSLENQKQQTEDFLKKLGGKKVCAVMDVTNTSPSSRETRDYNTKILPTMFNAIAFVSKKPVGRMIAHLFLGFNPMQFPVKMFADEQDAKAWIKQYT